MTTITGTATTDRGASRTHLSLDHGTFAVTSEAGILLDPKTNRSVGPGFLRVFQIDGVETDIEVPMSSVSWARDSLGRVTALSGVGTWTTGAAFRYETGEERENGDPRRSKDIDGTVIIA